jgi:hypothetical protein
MAQPPTVRKAALRVYGFLFAADLRLVIDTLAGAIGFG